nr:zinc finger protein 43 [Helicoverpa armigera]
MDDNPELALKKLCCTCLSRDRKLFQLCRIPEGVNNLYLLLSYDSEAYREGFYKDTASLHVCWECRAVMCRIMRFRQQACVAQRQLTSIVDGRSQIQTTCLSRLTTNHKTTFQKMISNSKNTELDNFIDCGLTMDIKSESEEDIPLSELHANCASDSETQVVIQTIDYKEELSKDTTDNEDVIFKLKKKKELKNGRKRKYFSTVMVVDSELEDLRLQSKMVEDFVNAEFKCDSCIEIFSSQIDLDEHNSSLHREKPDHLPCDICLVYTPITLYQDHRESHYHRHTCQLCVYTSFNINDMATHLKTEHSIDNLDLTKSKRKKGRHKTDLSKKESEGKRNPTMTDKRTPYGYLCTECNKYFDNKNQRWKHVQRHHREGYKCETCGKRFAFKNNLTRHELLHRGGPPRQQCEVCHKQVRVDLLKVHARTHTNRQTHTCVHCAKTFVSRASYEHHLKYTKAHALVDILKYKCTLCDKGYRSRGELRDHVNYQHMGKTQHKCPVCGKALATRRCITRHVRRAHEGVKESARDKICQQCGKAFRDKKGLREHELIHTGQRPLSCEICGCTFRQSASLYTHRKRVHNVCSGAKTVTLQE